MYMYIHQKFDLAKISIGALNHLIKYQSNSLEKYQSNKLI